MSVIVVTQLYNVFLGRDCVV